MQWEDLMMQWGICTALIVTCFLAGVGLFSLAQVAPDVDVSSTPFHVAPGYPLVLEIGQPLSLVLNDFDGDDGVDLALTALEGPSEDGKFTTTLWLIELLLSDAPQIMPLYKAEWEGGPAFAAVAIGDLNGSGHSDLVLVDFVHGGLLILVGNGRGEFQEISLRVPGSLGPPTDVGLADFDEDGRLDVIAPYADAVYVLWNPLREPSAITRIPCDSEDSSPWKVVAEDFNGDGLADFSVLGSRTTVTPIEYYVQVFLNNGGREFRESTLVTIREPEEWGTFLLATGDLNQDGHLDIVTARGGRVYGLLGKGDGHFDVDELYFTSDPFATDILVGDIFGSGCVNVLIAGWTVDIVFISQGCYTARRPRVLSLGGFRFPSPRSIEATDVNGDGVADLIVAGSSWKDNRQVVLLLVLLGGGQR